MSTQDIQEVELNIEFAKKRIELLRSFERLIENPDFKEVIEENYFREEAIRLVAAKSNPQITPEGQVEIDRDIMSVGRLQQYFQAIVQIGRSQEHNLAAYQETLEELHEEDLAE